MALSNAVVKSTLILLFIAVITVVGAKRANNPLWSCPRTPTSFHCLFAFPGLPPRRHQCVTDTDCTRGQQCCYSGCSRRCRQGYSYRYGPCDRVACAGGYTCREFPTPCESPPCALQASCITKEEARCPKLHCKEENCPPGFERSKGFLGCPTCQCVPEKDCPSTFSIFCAYGDVMKDGCRTGECLPEPSGPCTNLTCEEPGEECRLVMPAHCTELPCLPEPRCVPAIKPRYDDTCVFLKPTTQGRPVLTSKMRNGSRTDEANNTTNSNMTTSNITVGEMDDIQAGPPLNCSRARCPDHTVCTGLEEGLFVCCWEYTQHRVTPPPKAGACPSLWMRGFLLREPTTRCEVDHDCPGVEKCCDGSQWPGQGGRSGICLRPAHMPPPHGLCTNIFMKHVLTRLNICPA